MTINRFIFSASAKRVKANLISQNILLSCSLDSKLSSLHYTLLNLFNGVSEFLAFSKSFKGNRTVCSAGEWELGIREHIGCVRCCDLATGSAAVMFHTRRVGRVCVL